MKKYSQWSILCMAFIMLLVVMTACSFGGVPTAQKTATPTPKPEAPLQILKESQAKMNTLQSFALDGTYAGNTSSTGSDGNTDLQMKISGEALKSPESVSLQMDGTVTSSGISLPLTLAMLGVNQKVYIQNTKKQGPWYVMTDEQGKNFFGGVGSLSTTSNNMLDVATDADVTDHGMDTVNGKKLRHLSIVVTDSKKALKKAFLESTGDFKNLTPEQVDSIKLQTGTEDYWIDQTTLYVYQQADQYKAQYHVDASGAITSGSPNLTKDQAVTLMYSKFNEPVTIKAPENPQPLNSMLDLFT